MALECSAALEQGYTQEPTAEALTQRKTLSPVCCTSSYMFCCLLNGVKTSQLQRGGDKRIVDEPGRRRVLVLTLRLYGHHHRDGVLHTSALAC